MNEKRTTHESQIQKYVNITLQQKMLMLTFYLPFGTYEAGIG